MRFRRGKTHHPLVCIVIFLLLPTRRFACIVSPLSPTEVGGPPREGGVRDDVVRAQAHNPHIHEIGGLAAGYYHDVLAEGFDPFLLPEDIEYT